jgi:hypothetical protein
MHSFVLIADVESACRRGAFVRRVRGASSIRHSGVVAAARFPALAPQTRYRAFPPPWFRIVSLSRLRGFWLPLARIPVFRSVSRWRHVAGSDEAAQLDVRVLRRHRPTGVELELGSIAPHRVHRHGETPRHRHRRLVMPLLRHQAFAPGLDRGAAAILHQKDVGRLEQTAADVLVALFGDTALTVDGLARLLALGGEAEVGAHRLGAVEPARIVDRRLEAQRRDRPQMVSREIATYSALGERESVWTSGAL